MENKISWQQMDPPLDNGRRQWVEIRGNCDMKVVFGECNICGSDTYDEEEEIPNWLYNKKGDSSFGQNICHRCWVKI